MISTGKDLILFVTWMNRKNLKRRQVAEHHQIGVLYATKSQKT